MNFIEEESYSALEAISNKGLLAEDLSASSDIPKRCTSSHYE